MRYLIVNADDFGQTAGINRGVAEAHARGVVTSASLMVDEPGAHEAAYLSGTLPELSVGLHVKITDEEARPSMDLRDRAAVTAELERQLERFRDLLGREPDHLDSHHNVHLQRDARSAFTAVADRHGLLLRGCSAIRYFPSFYGQWDGETHLEHIGVASLIGMLERELDDEFTELGCHPGYADLSLASTYAVERETELGTLCDPRVRTIMGELGIELTSSAGARELLTSRAATG